MFSFSAPPPLRKSAVSFSVPLLAALVVVFALLGSAFVVRFAAEQENRALTEWQARLNLIADSRAADLGAWTDFHISSLASVAKNPSLQLYLSELQTTETIAEDTPQAVFLRNMLVSTADKLGFLDSASPDLKAIGANVTEPTGVGLAIMGQDGKILVATSGLGAIDTAQKTALESLPSNSAGMTDIFESDTGQPLIGFSAPVYPIQTESLTGKPIGRLLGFKRADSRLFEKLKHPGATESTLEALLLRQEGENVLYLSAAAKTIRQMNIETPELDAGFAIRSPGQFAIRKDFLGQNTLMTSRRIANSPWIMMVHVARNQALDESDRWRQQTTLILFASLIAFIACLLAIWHYGTSRRNKLLSLEKTRIAGSLAAKEKMLRVVSDNQMEPSFIVDTYGTVQFANAAAARNLRVMPEAVIGKSLDDLLGTALAERYAEANKAACDKNGPVIRSWRPATDDGKRVIRSAHIPLAHIPLDSLPEPTPGILIVDQDVSDIVNEREKRIHTMQQVVNALVNMVDKRDHHAANHSLAVALVSREIAASMALDPVSIETAETAGKLMNIGKMIVPLEILNRSTSLAEDEMKMIRDSFHYSIEVLEGIPFDGPVVDTLRQAQEKFDGTGPLGLKGDKILLTARITAVSNAFVAMVSPRSYHSNIMPPDQAIKILLQDLDKRFDHKVIATLAHFIENRNGYTQVENVLRREARPAGTTEGAGY